MKKGGKGLKNASFWIINFTNVRGGAPRPPLPAPTAKLCAGEKKWSKKRGGGNDRIAQYIPLRQYYNFVCFRLGWNEQLRTELRTWTRLDCSWSCYRYWPAVPPWPRHVSGSAGWQRSWFRKIRLSSQLDNRQPWATYQWTIATVWKQSGWSHPGIQFSGVGGKEWAQHALRCKRAAGWMGREHSYPASGLQPAQSQSAPAPLPGLPA